MTRTFRTATGKKVRVRMTEAEELRTILYRTAVVVIPCFWMVAFFKAAGLI